MIDYPFAGPDEPNSFQMAEPQEMPKKVDLPATGWYSSCYLCATGFDSEGKWAPVMIRSTRRNYEMRVHKVCLPKS